MSLDKPRTYYVEIRGQTLEVTIRSPGLDLASELGGHSAGQNPGEWQARILVYGEAFHIVGAYKPGEGIQQFVVNGEPMSFRVDRGLERLSLARRGVAIRTRAWSKLEHELYELMPPKPVRDTSDLLVSPMPGKVLAIYVTAGQAVRAGEEICVIEAMKMENVLYAARDALIAEVRIAPGDTVDADQLLVRLEPRGEPATASP